jgi:hypothetical protein
MSKKIIAQKASSKFNFSGIIKMLLEDTRKPEKLKHFPLIGSERESFEQSEEGANNARL